MSLRRFPKAQQADPSARSKWFRYAGPGTAWHLRAPAALPALLRGPAISARSTSSDGQWPGAATRAKAPQPAQGQRKELLFLSSRWGFCCINQLTEQPNRIKPKQSPKPGGKTSLKYYHWVMLHLWEGTPARPRGKKVDGASISASFFHRWAGRPTPLSYSFAASSAEQRAVSAAASGLARDEAQGASSRG